MPVKPAEFYKTCMKLCDQLKDPAPLLATQSQAYHAILLLGPIYPHRQVGLHRR